MLIACVAALGMRTTGTVLRRAEGQAMIRIIIDIEDHGDKLATNEAVAMALEQFGKARVVMVTDGKEPQR